LAEEFRKQHLEQEAELKRQEEEAEKQRLREEAEEKRLEEAAEQQRLQLEAEIKRLDEEAEQRRLHWLRSGLIKGIYRNFENGISLEFRRMWNTKL
jgi:hypothetical protein